MKRVIIYLLFVIMFIIGEAKCFIKIVNCNWEPIGKAEVIYTLSFVSGFGFIVGWIDIEDK